VPAIHGTGGAVDEGLRSLGRSSTGSAAVRRLRSVLIGSQFAVATPLLIVAGLLIGSLNQLRHVDLGFDSHNILTGGILLPPTLYRDSAQVIVFWSELRRRVAALPGVTAVAFTDSRPPEDAGNQNNFDLEAAPTPPEQSQPVTTWVAVTPEYFSLLGMRLVQGRLLNGDDNGDGPPVIVVDQAWASRFFPGQSAVGKRLQSGGCTTCPLTTIVGIVSNVMYDGLDRGNQGTVYTPIPERGTSAGSSRSRYLVLRTGTDPAAVLPAVRQTIRAIDSSLPFSRVATIDDLVAGALQTPRALSLLVGALALVAIILSAVGIYGVMAHYVQQHAKDISIRLALGGRPLSVLRLIVGRGMRLVSLGVLAGAAIAAVFARLMGSLLFGVGPADPFTFTAVTAAMLTTAALACWVPAARAIAMEPASVLRHE
jgi:predicted permease